MARIKNLLFSAKITPVIFYKLFEKYYSRTLPAMVRQSADTQIRSKNFGIASRAGATLHDELLQVIPFSKDKQIQSKFSGAIAKWLQLQSIQDIHPQDDIPCLHNFQFNPKTTLQERVRAVISINKSRTNSLEVRLPSFLPIETISAPGNTISVELKLTVAGCILQNGISRGSYTASYTITYNDAEVPAQTIALPFTQAPGNLIVIAASVTYNIFKHGKVEKCMEPSYMPCTIIKALYC